MTLKTVSGPQHPGVRYFCTTRQAQQGLSEQTDAFNLGLNTPQDAPPVWANRQRLQAHIGLPPLWLEQVHGNQVFDADQYDLSSSMVPRVDAVVTSRSDLALAILTADCLPVLFWNEQASLIGAAHAGWRGLAAGVLENTWLALQQKQTDSSGWHAWVGPAISQGCFEVGQQVYVCFVDQDSALSAFFKPGAAPGKWWADLAAIAAYKLSALSHQSITVHQSDLCTYTQADVFYSYRRSALTGRQASIIALQ